MKPLRSILQIVLVFLSINISGQELRIVNTKDLIKISEDYGLDSAIKLTNGESIFDLDQIVAEKLFEHSSRNKPSNIIENFIVGYALRFHDKNIKDILYNYFSKKRDEISTYKPEDYYGNLPRIAEDALFALIENSDDKTDSLLIKYYNDWNEKSQNYKSDYLKGQVESDPLLKEKLMSPYEDCNYNCYVILEALDSLKSSFFDRVKLETHQHNLKPYWQDGFGISKHSRYTPFKSSDSSRPLELAKTYNSIGEINFKEEVELRKIMDRYNESYCWKFVIFNNKVGYLDLGCQSEPEAGSGILYRLELQGNVLKIFIIQTWIS